MTKESESWMRFYEAMRKGDIECVDALVSSGANINERNDHGDTPLLVAICDLDVPWDDEPRNPDRIIIVSAIVERGADINALDKDGRGILTVPIFQVDIEFLEFLLDIGAKPNNGINSDGMSILDLAELDYHLLYFKSARPATELDRENMDSWIAYLDREAVHNGSQRPVCLSLLRARGAKTAEELSLLEQKGTQQ